MGYVVLARKWRPRTFEEVVGQPGVTRTLRNAIATGRIAQAYVFAGARGVGKTTTARILAKALNCVAGPTPDPCNTCEMCVEIAEGRDLDVLEIDAATNTQVDKVRETIIEPLGLRPVRDRYKIFIIDEVHMLSTSSFNALLKSIEEPPPHVVFMMATTELHRIPETITSRSQVFEFRTLPAQLIEQQLRRIADAEGLDVEPAALTAIARAAEGSLRDAESALDQVIAFAAGRITAADVSAVLGLVGRDLLLDLVETVADEEPARALELAARAVEGGHDLRLLVRELARLVRDLMVVAIDPERLADPEFMAGAEADRLERLARRFSREDLLRAFDLLSRAEFELRTSPHPRYHLEMALLRWIHLRRLLPLSEVIEALERGETASPSQARARGAGGGGAAGRTAGATRAAGGQRSDEAAQDLPLQAPASAPRTGGADGLTAGAPARPPATRSRGERGGTEAGRGSTTPGPAPGSIPETPPATSPAAAGTQQDSEAGQPLRERLLAEIKKEKRVVYNAAVMQAQRVDVEPGRVTFVFAPSQKVLRDLVLQHRPWLEATASRLAGGPVQVGVAEVEAPARADAEPSPEEHARQHLRQRALAEPAVQTLLDVFPSTEIRDVEEIP